MNRMTRGEKAFQAFNVIFMLLTAVLFLLPFVVLASSSLMSQAEAAKYGNYVIFARNPAFTAYKTILGTGSLLLTAYRNTLLRVVVGTLLNLIFTASLAYGLSKKEVPGRSFFMGLIFVTMFFSGGLIPNFLLIKGIGLYDTFWAMVIPGLISAWNMILMRNFFQQIPESLEEAAALDGASPIRTLISVIIPLSAPIIATMALFYGVAHWNSWFDAVIYLRDNQLWPLQVLLRNLIFTASSTGLDIMSVNTLDVQPPSTAVKSAVIIVSTVPILCVYPFLQKYFVKGLLVGAIKG